MPNPTEKPMNVHTGIPLTRSPSLILILDTPKGRGVFASQPIPARTILEVSPVLVLDPTENEEHIRKTDLYNYTYNWPYTPPDSECHTKAPNRTQALILGLGSMFNHSTLDQNVAWIRDIKNLTVTYTTLRDIREGEELCISYGDRLTFVDTDYEERKRAEEKEIEEEERARMAAIAEYVDELDSIQPPDRTKDAPSL